MEIQQLLTTEGEEGEGERLEGDGGYMIELNKIESFCYFWKYLWTADLIRKPKLQIVDTILFAEGRPHSWLFTSHQTGEILKKKADKFTPSSSSSYSQTVASIVDYFKKKSNQFKGYKSHDLRPKIAIVWFVRVNKVLSSYLVNDRELGSILSSELKEVIAIQTYMGGFALKGNGIFVHKITRASNGTVIHQSQECLDSLSEPAFACYTNKCKMLNIIEHPMSDRLKKMGSYLIRHLESISGNGEVNFLTIQVAFNSTWDPYLISVRDISLAKMPSQFYTHFNSLVYFDGKAPIIPSLHEQSSLLPSLSGRGEDKLASNQSISNNTSDSHDHHYANNRTTKLIRGMTPHTLDMITEDILEGQKVKLSNHETIIIPPPDTSQKASYFKPSNEDYSLRKDRPDLPFTAPSEHEKHLIIRTDSRAGGGAGRGSVFLAMKPSLKRDHTFIEESKTTHQQSNSQKRVEISPTLSPTSSFGITTAMIEELMQHQNRMSTNLSQSRPKSATLQSVHSKNSTYSTFSKRYQVATASSRDRTTYQGEDLDAAPKPLHHFFKARRPISAPHHK